MVRFIEKCKAVIARAAFWRKPAMPEAEDPADASGAESAPEAIANEIAPAKPSWLIRFKQLFVVRRRQSAAQPEPSAADKSRDEAEDSPAPLPKPSWFARLKQRFAWRRKPAEPETEPDDRTRIIEKPLLEPARQTRTSGAEPESAEEEAPPPRKRLKQFLLRLSNKWVWIPAASVALLALIAGVAVTMVQSAHEKDKLRAELKAAKQKLAQKTAAPAVAVKSPLPVQPAIAAPPEKKVDPAFDITGRTDAETPPGIDASDCVVKDKASVAQNLKNCIEGFNSAMAASSKDAKKP